MTRQRALVLRLVNASCNHPTAEDIFLLACREMPGIVRATVYNNLNALVDSGDIIRLHSADGAVHYDRTSHPHAHLICDRCGEIRDVELPPRFLTYATRNWGVAPQLLEVSGHTLCEACDAQDSSDSTSHA